MDFAISSFNFFFKILLFVRGGVGGTPGWGVSAPVPLDRARVAGGWVRGRPPRGGGKAPPGAKKGGPRPGAGKGGGSHRPIFRGGPGPGEKKKGRGKKQKAASRDKATKGGREEKGALWKKGVPRGSRGGKKTPKGAGGKRGKKGGENPKPHPGEKRLKRGKGGGKRVFGENFKKGGKGARGVWGVHDRGGFFEFGKGKGGKGGGEGSGVKFPPPLIIFGRGPPGGFWPQKGAPRALRKAHLGGPPSRGWGAPPAKGGRWGGWGKKRGRERGGKGKGEPLFLGFFFKNLFNFFFFLFKFFCSKFLKFIFKHFFLGKNTKKPPTSLTFIFNFNCWRFFP